MGARLPRRVRAVADEGLGSGARKFRRSSLSSRGARARARSSRSRQRSTRSRRARAGARRTTRPRAPALDTRPGRARARALSPQEDRNFVEALAEAGQRGEVSLKELNNLRVRIGGAAKSWLNNFIKKGNGVRVLVTLMWGRLLRERK